jgi:site-specific DNA-cytosine methylase
MKGIKVLSLFDGMSCGMIALERAGIEVGEYYSSEIDKYAMKVSAKNYPDIVQLGGVTKWREWDFDFSNVDLLLAGFPCQAWSIAGKQKGDNDPRGALVHDLISIWHECKTYNPNVKFLFENVRMKKEFLDYINDLFGVEPIRINSALVSAQNRVRYYWTNIGSVAPQKDKGLVLKDILETDCVGNNVKDTKRNRRHCHTPTQKSLCCTSTMYKGAGNNGMTLVPNVVKLDTHSSKVGLKCVAGIQKNKRWLNDGKTLQRNFSQGDRIYSVEGKSPTLSANSGGSAGPGNTLISTERPCVPREVNSSSIMHHSAIATDIKGHDCLKRIYSPDAKSPTLTTCAGGHREPKVHLTPFTYRKLTPLECERLQTLPEGYTDHVINTQRYKMIGNGWTVDVISHILSHLQIHSKQPHKNKS